MCTHSFKTSLPFFVEDIIGVFFFLSFFLFYFDTLSQYAVAFSMATTTNDTFPALFQCLIGVFIWFLFTALSYDTLFSSLRTLPNETISKLPFLRRVFSLFSSCFFSGSFLDSIKGNFIFIQNQKMLVVVAHCYYCHLLGFIHPLLDSIICLTLIFIFRFSLWH